VIATRRGLVVLAAIAIALLVVLVVDLARRTEPVERTLVPVFDEASVVRLGWTTHPVGPYLTLERATSTKDAPWKRTAPAPGAVEQTPVKSLLATLRGARWHRVKERDPREDGVHLAVDRATTRLELWIGRPIEGGEQAWIGIDDRSYLVDAWVARALVPSPIELAIRAPLGGIASVDEYAIDGMRIEGTPRRVVRGEATPPTSAPTTPASGLVLDPAFVAELERTLAELVIEELPRAPMGHGEVITIEMAGTRVLLGGPCESRVYMAATTGDGCVAREKADAVVALVAKLRGPPAAIIAHAPIPVGVESVTLVDGKTLDLRKRPMIDGADASTDEVLALMTVLRSPVDEVVTAPTTKPIGTLSIAIARGELQLSLYAGNLVARAGEALALRLAPDAFAVLGRGASAYRERTPWREEPTTIDEIGIDNVTYKRGAVLGEWTRTPVGPSDPASIEALVRALAEPRVIGVASTTVAHGRRVRLVVRPPTGGEKTHTLVIGAVLAAGCPAKIDGTTVLLPVEICHLVPR
jgi:hypothetical protein